MPTYRHMGYASAVPSCAAWKVHGHAIRIPPSLVRVPAHRHVFATLLDMLDNAPPRDH